MAGRSRPILAVTGVALLAVASTLPSLGVWFLGDDLEGIWRVTDTARGTSGAGPASVHWRPFTNLTLWANVAVAGLDPRWFHLTNVLAHAVCTVLVAVAAVELRRALAGGARPRPWTSSDRWTTMAAGALFATLPSHSEAVVWIAGRVDVLMTGWVLAALLLHLRSRRPGTADAGSVTATAGALAAYLAALASKESAVALVGVVVVVTAAVPDPHGAAGRLRRSALAAAPFLAVTVVWFLLRRWVLGSWLGGFDTAAREAGLIDVGRRAAALLVRSVLPPARPAVLAAAGVVLAVLTAAAIGVGRRCSNADLRLRTAAVSAACAAVGVLPVMALGVSATTPAGERLTYLPSAFLVVAAAHLGGVLHDRWPAPTSAGLGVLVLTGAVILMAGQTRWVTAGRLAEQIVDDLGRLPPDRPALVLNLPDDLGGVHLMRNATTPALALVHGWEDPALVWQASAMRVQSGEELVGLASTPLAGGHRWRLTLDADDVAAGAAWSATFDRAEGPAGRVTVRRRSDSLVEIGRTLSTPPGPPTTSEPVWWFSGGRLRRVTERN